MFNDNGSFLLALFEFFLFLAWFMCLFWVLGDIFRSKDPQRGDHPGGVRSDQGQGARCLTPSRVATGSTERAVTIWRRIGRSARRRRGFVVLDR